MRKLSRVDTETIFKIAEKLTGTCQQGKFRKESLVANIEMRIHKTKRGSLAAYLNYANQNDLEYQELVSALTIHTTSWFRERPHFIKLEKYIRENINRFKKKEFMAKCSPASSGEEIYSLGLVLESIKMDFPEFTYKIKGEDIDPVSIKKATRGVYSLKNLNQIPAIYHSSLVKGTGSIEHLFTVKKGIRKNCSFSVGDLMKTTSSERGRYDVIFCRNCMIYFSSTDVNVIIENLRLELRKDGNLCLAHSEAIIDPKIHGLEKSWCSTYRQKSKKTKINPSMIKTILIVDDSKSVRATFEKFMKEFSFNVLTAESADMATNVLKENHVDLITLDLNMPEKNGDVWLKEQRREGLKIPVMIVTEANINDAQDIFNILENGAEDYLKKSDINKDRTLIIERINSLIESTDTQIKNITLVKKIKQELIRPEVILIGASTGGTEALGKLLKNFPKNGPPIFVVQHMSATFAKAFADRLSSISKIPLGKVFDGIAIEEGKLYIADDDYHIGIKRVGNLFKFVRSEVPRVNRHRPSVDFLFSSAQNFPDKCAAILLTGMGNDGSKALLNLKLNNAMTFCQDEKSCVVYGMPREAINLGAAGFIGNISEIRQQINQILRL